MKRALSLGLSCLLFGPLGLGMAAPAQGAAPDYAHAPEMRRLLHWPRFPLRVYLVPGELADRARKTATLAGFDEWVRATRGFVQYLVVSDPAQADVTVTLLPEAVVPGQDAATGNTQLTFSGLVLKKAQVRLATGGVEPADLQATAAHEFGHALGIDGHSDDPDDLMYPVLFRADSTLTTDPPDLAPPSHTVTRRDLNTLKVCYPALAVSPPDPPQ